MQHRQSSEVCSGVWAWQLHVIIQNIVHSLTHFKVQYPITQCTIVQISVPV